MRVNARVCIVMATLAAMASVIGPQAPEAYAIPLWSLLDPEAAASAAGPSSSHRPNIIVYSEEAPCDPTPVAAALTPKTLPRRPRHRVRRRPVIHKAGLQAPPPVGPKPTRIVHHAAVLHKAGVKPHHRRLRPALHAVAAPKRCVILHSETLDSSDLAYADALTTPATLAPADTTPDFGLNGGGADQGDFGCGCGGGGGEAFPNPVSGSGGGTTVPGKKPPGPVTAAPEPQTWVLMILGVGLCGAVLRRVRRGRAARA